MSVSPLCDTALRSKSQGMGRGGYRKTTSVGTVSCSAKLRGNQATQQAPSNSEYTERSVGHEYAIRGNQPYCG